MSEGESQRLLPGEELVNEGLSDLAGDRISDTSLLVLIAGPRLRRLGVRVPERLMSQPWEHLLYERLEQRLGSAAHAHYNSLIRRVVSYAHALEREKSKV